jgi:predicted esterase
MIVTGPTLAPAMTIDARPERGELRSAPADSPVIDGAPGLHALDDRGARGSVVYVPEGYRSDAQAPLLVMLHGAGGAADQSLAFVKAYADAGSLIVLAPTSAAPTWDVIADGGYGPDVQAIDAALTWIFERYAIDRDRIAIGGFSDGASYALSLGLTNGRLFTHVLAFSPGLMRPTRRRGRPEVFVSHGLRDDVLPIQRCSRILVPEMERERYRVRYVEFRGGHAVPEMILRQAFDWFL